jgi:sugar phosphate isomerase/epimerase
MNHPFDRRTFLKAAGAAGIGLGCSQFPLGRALAAPLAQGSPHAEKLGWRLGCQAYSFNRFTFFEAVDKTASLGLRWIEAYPGQRLSAEKPEAKMGPGLSADERAAVKQKLQQAGVQMVCFGVTGANRGTFEFAKDMGVETIVSEPGFEQIDEIEKLCEEFEINLALHNHPKPSRYWDPDVVLKVCEGRGKRIGACADTGHWMRSGIRPLDAVRKLEGRIISFHFKDLNQMGGGHDVPWGTGKGDVAAVLAELKRQGFKGVFSIEYEHNWENSLPEIAECVKFFDATAAKLLAAS